MIVGTALVLAGVVLSVAPFSITLSFEGRAPVTGKCGRPICIARQPTSGWVAYAPNTGASFFGGPCAAKARWRLAISAGLVALGAITIILL